MNYIKISRENMGNYVQPFTKIVEMQINDLCEKLRIEEEK